MLFALCCMCLHPAWSRERRANEQCASQVPAAARRARRSTPAGSVPGREPARRRARPGRDRSPATARSRRALRPGQLDVSKASTRYSDALSAGAAAASAWLSVDGMIGSSRPHQDQIEGQSREVPTLEVQRPRSAGSARAGRRSARALARGRDCRATPSPRAFGTEPRLQIGDPGVEIIQLARRDLAQCGPDLRGWQGARRSTARTPTCRRRWARDGATARRGRRGNSPW